MFQVLIEIRCTAFILFDCKTKTANSIPYSRISLSLGETLMTVLFRVYLLAVHVASCIEILFDRRSSIFGVYLFAVCVT